MATGPAVTKAMYGVRLPSELPASVCVEIGDWCTQRNYRYRFAVLFGGFLVLVRGYGAQAKADMLARYRNKVAAFSCHERLTQVRSYHPWTRTSWQPIDGAPIQLHQILDRVARANALSAYHVEIAS